MTDLLSSTDATPTVRPPARGPIGHLRRFRRRPWGDPLIAGVFGLIVSAAFSWVPSVWFDESATVVSATRSWKQLWTEIQNVDAVHATYYGLMHCWFDLVGYTPFSLRFPSALAVGVGAALLVLLAREMLGGRRVALVAGLVFVLLPRVTWMGSEGRSYATATTLTIAMTLVFLHAVKRSRSTSPRGRWWWALYGLLALLSCFLFLYTALVVVGHAVTIALWAFRGRRSGRMPRWGSAARGWLVAAIVAGALSVPVALLSHGQSKQISWIKKPNLGTVNSFFTWQWFMENTLMAVFGWILVAVGIFLIARRRPRYDIPNVVQVSLPWVVVPALGLISASVVTSPLYSPRYVAFGAPAIALLMAVTLTAIRRRSVIAAGLVVTVALTVPSYVGQRLPEAKDSSSWAEVASLIQHERSTEAGGGDDAIIYGHLRRHHAASARNIAYTYPAAFAGMTDVTLKTPAAETGSLWETRYPLADTIDRIDGHRYVWLVTSSKQDLRPSVTAALKAKGYDLDDEWNLTWVNVLRYER